MDNVCAVILAAGDGKRMKSAKPKVLSEVLFKPMIRWVVDNCRSAGIDHMCAVLGHGSEMVLPHLPENCMHVLQAERKGTGHAASMTRDYLREGGFSHVVVLNGDAPFVSDEVLRRAYELHIQDGNSVTVISARVEDPGGYGRIIRFGEQVIAIVEEKDANVKQKAVHEISSGAFWFRTDALLAFFDHMRNDNEQGEYYLPDAVADVIEKGGRAGAYRADAMAVLGANDRQGLAQLGKLMRRIVYRGHRENGVDIPFSEGVVIGPDVKIGPDTRILPGTILKGNTVIGSGCEIGPNSYLDNAMVGDGCKIISSYVQSARLDDFVKIGPMSNIRPDSHLKPGAKIGDFVEIKNSTVGESTAVAHLSYIGDSDVGGGCNFGCGVVTVNYDGGNKYRTVVGNDVFVGCNANLIAPVQVGDRAYVAAGTTVTSNVPSDALAIGRARQAVKEGWAKKKALYRKKR